MACRVFFAVLLFLALALLVPAAPKELAPGSTYRLVWRSVDGKDLSTSDGHVTILTVVTRRDEEKARAVGDLVPERYLGDQKYRYVTLVNFERKIPGALQGFTRAIIRSRLTSEANDLKARYAAKHLTRDPRGDIHVIADFDGSAVEGVGLAAEGAELAVFVFNGEGKLIARWSDVPPGQSLPRALATAE